MRSVVGIDFGGRNLRGGMVSARGKLLGKVRSRKTQCERPGKQIAADIVGIAEGLCRRQAGVEAVAIGSPGIVLPDGRYGWPPCNCPNWGAVNLKALVEERLGKPCFVNNDAQVFGSGERMWGAGKGAKCMLLLTLGTGIGGGVSYAGRDFQGARNTIEIGHICVDFSPNAQPCGCGLAGCVEAYASDTGIARQGTEAIEAGLVPKTRKKIDAQWVYSQAKAGNIVAAEIVGQAHQALAVLITNFANALSIDVCVLAGGITNAGDYLFDDVGRRVKARLLPTAAVDVRPASLGSDFGILGAAAYGFSMLDGG